MKLRLKERWITLAQQNHRLLIALVASSMLGLLGVQTYLISLELSVQQHNFNETIDDALLDMHHQIEEDPQLSAQLIVIFQQFEQQQPRDTTQISNIKSQVQHMMDSVLQAFQLASLEYDFAFYQTAHGDVILSSAGQATTLGDFQTYSERAGHRVRNALGEGRYRFGIFFHNQYWYLVKQTVALLFISLLLITLLLGSFLSTLVALRRQKAVDQLKNDFINNLAHELKTPIFASSVIFRIIQQHLQRGDLKKTIEPLQLLVRENQQLKDKVDKVLELASMEEGKLHLEKRTVDLHNLIRETIPSYQYRVAEQGGSLSCELLAASALVNGNPQHLQNVLQNLLDNALKYSPEEPQIKIKTETKENDVSLTISDQGIGIKTKDQPYIFDSFYRVAQGDAHNVNGFGLGLSYVKQLVELHQGQILLKSQPGEGTIFTLTFPLLQTHQHATA